MSTVADQFIAYAQEKRLSVQTLQRWQAWPERDQAAFFPMAKMLQLNENQLRDFLDWFEDITARDGSTVPAVLARPEIQHALDANLSRNDKLKAVKEALRRVRYPRLSQLEDSLRATIRALDLGNRVRVSFPPALEGNDIILEIKAHNIQEIRDSLARVQQTLEDGSLQRVFDLLDEA